MNRNHSELIGSPFLFSMLKRFKNKIFPSDFIKKYGQVDEYYLRLNQINLIFSTKDPYSKSWFFPRYDNGNYHEPAATQIFMENIKKSDFVVDIGAHIGYFSCLSAKLAQTGQVHIFEADHKCLPLIQKNLDLNQINNVYINNVVVSDKNDFELVPEFRTPNPGLQINQRKTQAKRVRSLTLDKYLSLKKISPSFVKIDVEGAELKVLQGMTKLLEAPQLKILIEVHVDKLKNNFNSSYRPILELLSNHQFYLEQIPSHRSLTESSRKKIDPKSILSGNTMIFCHKST